MSTLKARLREDLTAAMKAREELQTGTLRMVLAAVSVEEKSGKSERELSDAEVLAVLNREMKKRREAAEAFETAGRAESAAQERAESVVIAGYLPQQLTDEELASIVADAIAEVGATEQRQMGQVMKVVQPKVTGRAEGGRIAAEVRKQLS